MVLFSPPFRSSLDEKNGSQEFLLTSILLPSKQFYLNITKNGVLYLLRRDDNYAFSGSAQQLPEPVPNLIQNALFTDALQNGSLISLRRTDILYLTLLRLAHAEILLGVRLHRIDGEHCIGFHLQLCLQTLALGKLLLCGHFAIPEHFIESGEKFA